MVSEEKLDTLSIVNALKGIAEVFGRIVRAFKDAVLMLVEALSVRNKEKAKKNMRKYWKLSDVKVINKTILWIKNKFKRNEKNNIPPG